VSLTEKFLLISVFVVLAIFLLPPPPSRPN